MSVALVSDENQPTLTKNDKKTKIVQDEERFRFHTFTSEEILSIHDSLLRWYDVHQRTLPWRSSSKVADIAKESEKIDPSVRGYQVWVSEIMLQQTQVNTVVDYYVKWMKQWPTVQDLAKANVDDVYKTWAGLGYYSRAKRLHEAAQVLVDKYQGALPQDAKLLEQLIPGIGPYTAGAISSIAFNQVAPLVDGNVIRVLSRLRMVGADVRQASTTDFFWKLATDLCHPVRPGDFNQSLMELGATVCTPLKPLCSQCPVKLDCNAYQYSNRDSRSDPFTKKNESVNTRIAQFSHVKCEMCGELDIEDCNVTDYPFKTKKKPVKLENIAVCILQLDSRDKEVLLMQRPDDGLLAKLWEFPSVLMEDDEDIPYESRSRKMDNFLQSIFNSFPETCTIQRKDIGISNHLFTHLKHTYFVEHLVLSSDFRDILSSKSEKKWKWLNESDIEDAAIPTGLKNAYKLLERVPKTHERKRKSETQSNQVSLTSFFAKK